MELQWTQAANSDLMRLYAFLAPANQPAAARVVQALSQAPTRLLANQRFGEQLPEFAPREARRLLVGQCELRYELLGSTVCVLRRWHTREHR